MNQATLIDTLQTSRTAPEAKTSKPTAAADQAEPFAKVLHRVRPQAQNKPQRAAAEPPAGEQEAAAQEPESGPEVQPQPEAQAEQFPADAGEAPAEQQSAMTETNHDSTPAEVPAGQQAHVLQVTVHAAVAIVMPTHQPPDQPAIDQATAEELPAEGLSDAAPPEQVTLLPTDRVPQLVPAEQAMSEQPTNAPAPMPAPMPAPAPAQAATEAGNQRPSDAPMPVQAKLSDTPTAPTVEPAAPPKVPVDGPALAQHGETQVEASAQPEQGDADVDPAVEQRRPGVEANRAPDAIADRAAAVTAQPAQAKTEQIAPAPPRPAAPPPAPVTHDAEFAQANHPNIVTGMKTQLVANGGTMRLHLDPPTLGTLHITVQMRDGVMTASFQTSSDEATRLLSHSLGQLKRVLESQGVSVEKLHVQQTPRDQPGSSSNEDQPRQWQQEEQSARQEQQRREMLRRMWRRLGWVQEPLDLVA